MNLLAFDTSTEFLSLALQANGQIYSHYQYTGQAASKLILPQIQVLLKTAKLKLTDLDGIAFGAGPGAFTGVRVACGVAQGLGFGVDVPVVGVNTLHAIAQASSTDKVIVCTDARMGEVYFAALEKQEKGWVEISVTQVCRPESSPILDSDAWIGAGSGWAVFDEVLSAHYPVTEKLPQITPTAEAILELATPIFQAGKAKPASEARPIYIRNRVALTSIEREQGQRL
ncbi:MAG: tRNA (adenosine(37)-N6)-threonylcarbamoyltransferase complex dimerization subunit type 1 TsaB [Methylophilaceae bacterium]